MSVLIEDEATVAAINTLAEMKKKSVDDVVREAVDAEIRREEAQLPLRDRLKAIGDSWAKVPKSGEKADKAFFDDLGGNL